MVENTKAFPLVPVSWNWIDVRAFQVSFVRLNVVLPGGAEQVWVAKLPPAAGVNASRPTVAASMLVAVAEPPSLTMNVPVRAVVIIPLSCGENTSHTEHSVPLASCWPLQLSGCPVSGGKNANCGELTSTPSSSGPVCGPRFLTTNIAGRLLLLIAVMSNDGGPGGMITSALEGSMPAVFTVAVTSVDPSAARSVAISGPAARGVNRTSAVQVPCGGSTVHVVLAIVKLGLLSPMSSSAIWPVVARPSLVIVNVAGIPSATSPGSGVIDRVTLGASPGPPSPARFGVDPHPRTTVHSASVIDRMVMGPLTVPCP